MTNEKCPKSPRSTGIAPRAQSPLDTYRLFRPVLSIARFFSRRATLWLAEAIGTIASFCMKRTRVQVARNLEWVRQWAERNGAATAFETEEQKTLARRTFCHFACALVEYAYLSFTPARAVLRLFRLDMREGESRLRQALAAGRGAIVVSPHLGHWELGAVLLALLGFRVNVVTLAAPDVAINRFREKMRARFGIASIYLSREKGELEAHLAMLAALRRGELVTMLLERESAGGLVEVRMFDRPFMMPKGAAALAALTGAPIVPAFVLHAQHGTYMPVLEKPLYADPAAQDRDAELRRLIGSAAAVFERRISAHPDQWYNFV